MKYDYDIITIGFRPAGMAVPTMRFLTKRSSETWMMNKMKSGWLQHLCQMMFQI